jgi:predicted metal-binding membrane protein
MMDVTFIVGVMYIVWIIIIVRDHTIKEKMEPGDHETFPSEPE